ncbi:MAG: murein biosynthesis integral membrane protein MurJ [Thermoflexales bacterium]|nr:murein biosynthesis integral membrane protein MurJ [Thermoflexales bacterium]
MNSSNRQIARASAVVMAAFVASRLMGLLRDVVITAQLGTSDAADAYLAAFRIPDLIFFLLAGGALASAFIPAFSAYLARDDEAGAWRLTSGVINLLLFSTGLASALAALFAPQLVGSVLAPGFSPEKQAMTVPLVRVMLISPVIFGVSGLIMGVLNTRGQFLLPGLAPAAYNLGIILGAALLTPLPGPFGGPMGAAIGAVAGAALHFLVQLPGLFKAGCRYSPVLSLRDEGVRQVLRLMGPRVLGLAVLQLNFWVETNLASHLGSGAVAALNYAFRLMLLPQGVFAQSVATAAFPTFASQATRGQKEAMRDSLLATLRAIVFVSLPAAVGLLVLCSPLVALLFERGQFHVGSTQIVATALAWYAPGLVAHSAIEILVRAFYALHDTRTPVAIGVAAMLANLALSLLLIGPMGIAGLALANTIAAYLEMALLLALIRPRLGGLGGWRTAASSGKAGLASLAMGAAVWLFLAATSSLPSLVRGAGGVVVGAVVYGVAALLLGAEEVRLVLDMVRRKRKA